MDCIFCAIVAGQEPTYVVHEDGATVSFLDVGAATRGHTLVVPRNHVRDIWDLSLEDGGAVMASAQHVAGLLRRALSPPGLNLLQSSGEAAGQDVFHFHLHLVPRYPGDGWVPPWTPTNPSRAELEGLAALIRAASPK